ncbi:MAG: hypothetical protein PCFJNLEI_04129 [Verrucomicrobiae bacterium]|nr:hypothetical protein [Verrucomicrobiae bacterium]
MIQPNQLLAALPSGLRDPLVEEYNCIVRNYAEHRWSPSELSGGRFCEIVYTVLQGYSSGHYAAVPSKPRDFVGACRALETVATNPRSFQILIPRMLPALYEIRNNRGVGHVGGDVDPNPMDAAAVLAMASWILAELVRVFHNLPVSDAQKAVDSLVERRIPFVWTGGQIRRVLDPKLPLKDQILLLLSSCASEADVEQVFQWTGYKNRAHFNRILRTSHNDRLIEWDESKGTMQMLPPGSSYVTKRLRELAR